MKPLKLIISGFGPYADREVIDFSKLENERIFLITGPTGAGKTTIFDAISYAIFGEASGSDRDADNLRSDFAGEDILTYVELEFLLRGEKYYIKRIPKQKKKKARGEGYTEQKADAEFKISDGRIVTGVNDVNAAVNSIMGINYSQFRQIVMIPQGEFRQLLLAESKEREIIFRRIFGTFAFQRIQESLETRAKNLYKEIAQMLEQIKANVKSIDCSESDSLINLVSSENMNVPLIEEELKKLNEEDSSKEKNIKNLREENEKERQLLEKKLYYAVENNKKLEEKDKLSAERNELLKNQKEIIAKEVSLIRGRKALNVALDEKYYLNLKNNVENKNKELLDINNKVEDSSKQLKESKRLLELEEGKEEQRKSLYNELIKLKSDEEKIKDYVNKEEALKKIKVDLEHKKKESSLSTEYIKKLKENIQKLNIKIAEAKEAAVKYVEDLKKLDEKEMLLKKINKLFEEHRKLLDIRNKWLEEKKKFDLCEKKYKDSKSSYERMNEIFRKGQAGILAAGLVENVPCPVCGAIHHPSPAVMVFGVPSEEELKRQEEDFKRYEAQNNAFMNELTRINTEGKAKKSLVDDLKKEINEYINEDISEFEKDLLTSFIENVKKKETENIVELKAKIEKLKAVKDKEAIIKKELEEKSVLLEKEEEKNIKLGEEYTAFFGKYESETKIINKIKEELPEGIASIETLNEKIKAISRKYSDMDKAFKDSQENCRKAELGYTATLSNKKSKEIEIEALKEELKSSEEKFELRIIEEGFVDEEDYKKSKLSENEIEELDNQIKVFNEKLNRINSMYEKIVKETEELSTINLDNINEEIKLKQNALKEIEEKEKKIFARMKHNKDILSSLERINKIIENREENYRIVGELANIAKGENSQRISFERYMLAAYFDDIIKAANIRLKKMNAGRYELDRIKEKLKGRGQQGLELEVFDNYTGKPRHVKTLSGGESFKASLALALGLADVVQAYSGGINIDTMFIDEGFGTLDPESLDNAIQCLVNLQNSNRLVGIISHVPELKERIKTRLEVTAGINGSHVKLNM